MPVGSLPTPIGGPTTAGVARSMRDDGAAQAVGHPRQLRAERDALGAVADRDAGGGHQRAILELEAHDLVGAGAGHPRRRRGRR